MGYIYISGSLHWKCIAFDIKGVSLSFDGVIVLNNIFLCNLLKQNLIFLSNGKAAHVCGYEQIRSNKQPQSGRRGGGAQTPHRGACLVGAFFLHGGAGRLKWCLPSLT